MANALYGKGRERFLNGDIDWAANTIKAFLIDAADYTVVIDTHEFAWNTVVPAAAKVATSAAFASKTSTLGVADAADITFSAVTGDISEAIIIYVDGATPGTDDFLIAYIDSGTGLPVTPNGGDITVQWDAGANKIFKL